MGNCMNNKNRAFCTDVKENNPVSCNSDMQNHDDYLTGSGYVAKVPVMLASFKVRIPVNTVITLPEPALEIKRIKKKIKITQCLLIPGEFTLFIKGFIRKNIEYASPECSNSKGVCGYIRHCTIDVPFKCTTPINNWMNVPEILKFNHSYEFQYLSKEKAKGPEFAEKDELQSGDFSEYNQESDENFLERPYCELIGANIVEFDEYLDRKHLETDESPFEEKVFRQVEQKMMVYVELKIMQLRQIALPSTLFGVEGWFENCPCSGQATIVFDRMGYGDNVEPVITDTRSTWEKEGFTIGTTYRARPSLPGCHFKPVYIDFTFETKQPIIFSCEKT